MDLCCLLTSQSTSLSNILQRLSPSLTQFFLTLASHGLIVIMPLRLPHCSMQLLSALLMDQLDAWSFFLTYATHSRNSNERVQLSTFYVSRQLQKITHSFTLVLELNKSILESETLGFCHTNFLSSSSSLGVCLLPTHLNSIVELRCALKNLLLFDGETMHDSTYENSMLYPWPTFSLLSQEGEKVVTGNNQLIMVMAS